MVGGSGGGSNLVINFPSGFASAGAAIRMAFEASIASGKMVMPNNTPTHEAGAGWYTTPVNIRAFTTTFGFTFNTGGASGTAECESGFTFCIQNSNATSNPGTGGGTNATADANLCGLSAFTNNPAGSAIAPSVAIKFDANDTSTQPYPPGSAPNSVGCYINGGPIGALYSANDLNPTGLSFYSNHSYIATITYDGAILTLVLLDTTSNAQARYTWPVNIPAAVGANTALVGFTGGQVFSSSQITAGAIQSINSWEFWDGSVGTFARLAAPAFSVPAGQYGSAQSVALTGPGTIYYTTNGLLPTSASTQYTGTPISVTANTVINAISISTGLGTDSYVSQALYQIGTSNFINFPSGFSVGNVIPTGYGHFSGSTVVLTDILGTGGPFSNNTFETGAVWFPAPVPISNFATSVKVKITSVTNPSTNDIGFVFVLQNQPAAAGSYALDTLVSGGPLAIGNTSTAFGYGYPVLANSGTTGGFLNSIGLSFNIGTNAVGLYTNGAKPTGSDTTITGVTLTSGNILTIALSYNGTTLSLTLTDTVTLGTFSHSWTVNIPSTVGASTAYAGLTAASGAAVGNIVFESWTL